MLDIMRNSCVSQFEDLQVTSTDLLPPPPQPFSTDPHVLQ